MTWRSRTVFMILAIFVKNTSHILLVKVWNNQKFLYIPSVLCGIRLCRISANFRHLRAGWRILTDSQTWELQSKKKRSNLVKIWGSYDHFCEWNLCITSTNVHHYYASNTAILNFKLFTLLWPQTNQFYPLFQPQNSQKWPKKPNIHLVCTKSVGISFWK